MNEPNRDRNVTTFHQVLILIVGALFLAGRGGAKSIGDSTREAVEDRARSERAGLIADGIEDSIASYHRRIASVRDAFFSQAARYDATSNELSAALARGLEEVQITQAALLDSRFRLVAETTAEEWSRICKALEAGN